MNAIPLINNIPKTNINNEKQLRQEINTSLVALKKEAGTLEGLINEAAQMLVTINNRIATLENDTVKKSDIVDVIQSGNLQPVTSNAVADKISSLDVSSVGGSGKYISAISETDGKINATATDLGNMVPVDTVASGDMHSVTSNAVANTFGTWETLWSSGNSIIKGIVCNGKAFVTIHLQGFVCSSNDYLITTIAEKYRPRTVSRGFCFSAENPLLMGYINVEANGNVNINGMNGKTVYGDSFIMIEKDV